LFNYLDPFAALISASHLIKYSSVYVATPIFHGYGLAIMLLFCALGKKIVICRHFRTEQACELVQKHGVEVVTLVPLMLQKMLNSNVQALRSLKCILSGSAELSPKLIKHTIDQLGAVLYNLYGTSETGLNIIATPADLMQSDRTVGRAISGVQLKVTTEHGQEVKVGEIGQICVRNRLTAKNNGGDFVKTGDLAHQDTMGKYYLCGRVDSMIVSAGENVYPFEVEQILHEHPDVEDVAVIGVDDDQFGQRLKAFVVLKEGNKAVGKDDIVAWLRSRAARFQMPREIVIIDQIPYTSLGKRHKRALK